MTAVLFVSHLINERYLERYLKLYNNLKGQYDVYWLFQTDNGISDFTLREHDINVAGFTLDNLNELHYSPIGEHIIPGSVHFIIEHFYHMHPEYDYYWIIEYDVVFTGDWAYFIGEFTKSDADMIASYIEFRCEQNANWKWWDSLTFAANDKADIKRHVKAFTPIYRISNRALNFIDGFLKRPGNMGHCEAIIPTALYNNGFHIEDIGGTGEFVAPDCHNRFYVQDASINRCTIRWRPTIHPEDIETFCLPNKLFHPVK